MIRIFSISSHFHGVLEAFWHFKVSVSFIIYMYITLNLLNEFRYRFKCISDKITVSTQSHFSTVYSHFAPTHKTLTLGLYKLDGNPNPKP